MPSPIPANIEQPDSGTWTLSGHWTVSGMGPMPRRLEKLACRAGEVDLDGSRLAGIDSAGVWVLSRWLAERGASANLTGWPPRFKTLMELVGQREARVPVAVARPSLPASIGRSTLDGAGQSIALIAFVGEVAVTGAALALEPGRIRWRTVLRNIQVSGFEALPIVGLTSFLLGIVVAYQGADQLRHYGANIFVVDLVGVSMLREFAPLITAIIVAGRSGSSYAAQIGTMAVTEEIDAMRTLGIAPLELLVLPKVIALMIALPLLTVFADVLGVFGGMIMARAQLGVGFGDFLDRFVKAVVTSTYLTGLAKAPVFAAIIAVIGCHQGFLTKGGADSVGRQTTHAVVQSIFLVIVADALFSIAFSALDL